MPLIRLCRGNHLGGQPADPLTVRIDADLPAGDPQVTGYRDASKLLEGLIRALPAETLRALADLMESEVVWVAGKPIY